MKKHLRDNLSKFSYDGGRVSLAVLVIGLMARGPFSYFVLFQGILSTLIFIFFGVMIDLISVEENR